MTTFGDVYSEAYDAIYEQKSYRAEAAELAQALGDLGISAPAKVLDLGCGTGRHMEELALLGFQVVGVDASPAMLRRARHRLGPAASLLSLEDFDASALEFDAAYSLFDVLSYQQSTLEIETFMHRLTSHVRSGGVVAVDCWHLAGMVSSPPEYRTSTIRLTDERVLVREVAPAVRWEDSIVDLTIRLTEKTPSGSPRGSSVERHTMRAFTQLEMDLLASANGLVERRIRRALGDPRSPGPTDWHMTLVAKKA